MKSSRLQQVYNRSLIFLNFCYYTRGAQFVITQSGFIARHIRPSPVLAELRRISWAVSVAWLGTPAISHNTSTGLCPSKEVWIDEVLSRQLQQDQFGLLSTSLTLFQFVSSFGFSSEPQRNQNSPRDSELLCKVLLELHGPNLSGDPSVTTKRIQKL